MTKDIWKKINNGEKVTPSDVGKEEKKDNNKAEKAFIKGLRKSQFTKDEQAD